MAYKRDAIGPFCAYMRNIANVCLVIGEWANNHGDVATDEVNWADVGSAAHVLEELNEVAAFIGLDVKEV